MKTLLDTLPTKKMNSFILDWAQTHLSDGRLQSNEREWIAPSPFLHNDYKRHFSLNVETGLWRCWKSGEVGNFPKLIALVEGTSYSIAKKKIMRESLFNSKPTVLIEEWEPEDLEIASNFYEVTSASSLVEEKALDFYKSRGLSNLNIPTYVGSYTSRYKERVIIPYFRTNWSMFSGRALFPNMHPKYLNPGLSEGIRASNFLSEYSDEESHLFVTEGVLDALSLRSIGINATCLTGVFASTVQMRYIFSHPGDVVMALDNDKAGQDSIKKIENLRKKYSMKSFYISKPPDGCKDWNEALLKNKLTKESLMSYVPYDFNYIIKSSIQS